MNRGEVRKCLGTFAWTCLIMACGVLVALLLTSCGPRRYETITCKDGSVQSGPHVTCDGRGGRA